jgi:hypothetical protein
MTNANISMNLMKYVNVIPEIIDLYTNKPKGFVFYSGKREHFALLVTF